MPNYDCFTGCETGLIKGISIKENVWINLNKINKIDRTKEIASLDWNNDEESEVCIGFYNQSVGILNSDYNIETFDCSAGDVKSSLVACCKTYEKHVTCTNSGVVQVWANNFHDKFTFNIGKDICFLKKNKTEKNLISTGGKENELKIWDLANMNTPLFQAKNVKNDWLNLRVPVWITNACFIPDSKKIISSTSYNQVRLYDTNIQKRPVLEIKFEDSPIAAIDLVSNQHQVVVGNAHGVMGLLDLRGKGHLVHKFKGSTGAIKSIQCHSSENVFACCGLDRFLRVYDINSKLLLYKFYLKSRMNCLLLKTNCLSNKKDTKMHETKTIIENRIPEVQTENDIWSEMEVIETLKRKKTPKGQIIQDIQKDHKNHIAEITNNFKKKRKNVSK